MLVISSTWLSDVPIHERVKHRTETYPEQSRTVNWTPNRNFKMMFENSIYYTHESANTQNVSTGDKSV